MSKQVLIISGPTASGKTDLAIKIAKKFNGVLISADSRQVYIGMDIGTGKDHPADVSIHLIDLIKPSETFSVAQYRQLALQKIKEIHSQNKLPIIVGGSGQYIDAVINSKPTYSVKPNNFLRFFLNHCSVPVLQFILKNLDFRVYSLLNSSDVHNPRRLIRKVEIKLSKKSHLLTQPDFDILHLSLTAPNSFLFSRVDRRITHRLKQGLTTEISNLLKQYKWSDPGLNTLAYKEFNPSQKNPIEKWTHDERAYVRRQKTWFKKQPNITFIDITQNDYVNKTLALVKKWYNFL